MGCDADVMVVNGPGGSQVLTRLIIVQMAGRKLVKQWADGGPKGELSEGRLFGKQTDTRIHQV